MKAVFAAAVAVTALLMLGGGAGAVSSPGLDQMWLQHSIMDDHFAISGATYAEIHGRIPQVKALAAQLYGDHTWTLERSTAMARSMGMSASRAPEPVQQWLLLTLKTYKPGLTYDQAYSSLEVQQNMQA